MAFNAFALLDGFGNKAPPVIAANTLVDDILAAVAQAKHGVTVKQGACSDDTICALQSTFMMALPQACTPSSPPYTCIPYCSPCIPLTCPVHPKPPTPALYTPILALHNSTFGPLHLEPSWLPSYLVLQQASFADL